MGAVSPPDSLVIFSHGAFAFSRERRVRRRASLGTRQSGAGFGLAEPNSLQLFSSFLGNVSST
jgi:hypothetical protein